MTYREAKRLALFAVAEMLSRETVPEMPGGDDQWGDADYARWESAWTEVVNDARRRAGVQAAGGGS